MEFYNEILCDYFKENGVGLSLKEAESIVEGSCYKVLKQIKSAIENKQLSDTECFNAIEDIVCAFERSGIKCAYRHDF